jgi:hypothetical protein
VPQQGSRRSALDLPKGTGDRRHDTSRASATILPGYPCSSSHPNRSLCSPQPPDWPHSHPRHPSALSFPLVRPTNSGHLGGLSRHSLPRPARSVPALPQRRGSPAELPDAFDPVVDVTGDGVPELFIQNDGLRILSCSDGEYEQILHLPYDHGALQGPTLELLSDANNNGIPELIVSLFKLTRGGGSYDILEWSTRGFRSLVLSSSLLPFKPYYPYLEPGLSCDSGVSLRDFDNDGQQELDFCNGLPFWDVCAVYPPWRVNWNIYEIDAEGNYVPFSVTCSPPEFRFQALHDGDRLTLYGDYESAIRMYQDAIFSDKLDWWSAERREFYCQRAFQNAPVSKSDIDAARIKSGQVLSPDPSEYPTIAAYARFRIMLQHIVRNWLPEAEIAYKALISKHPHGPTGSQFADMATAFMDEYRQSADIELACSVALRAISPPDDTMFRYLGYEYERHRYGMLCPFGPLVPLPHPASP